MGAQQEGDAESEGEAEDGHEAGVHVGELLLVFVVAVWWGDGDVQFLEEKCREAYL